MRLEGLAEDSCPGSSRTLEEGWGEEYKSWTHRIIEYTELEKTHLEAKEGRLCRFCRLQTINLNPSGASCWAAGISWLPWPQITHGPALRFLPPSQQWGWKGVMCTWREWEKGREEMDWNGENDFWTIHTCSCITHQRQHFKKVNTLAELIAVLPLKFQCNFWFLPLFLIFQLSRF